MNPSLPMPRLLYMLDTNIVSAEFRAATPAGAKLATLSSEQWCISAITWSELCFGLALRPEATRLAQLLQTFGRVARILPWDAQAAERHAQVRAAQRQKGLPIGDFDEMIAAHALSVGAILVTDNTRHFARIDNLMTENWLRADD